ncbi:hypothetical protein JOQ06_015895, partial [Pogonophryne albipinna]
PVNPEPAEHSKNFATLHFPQSLDADTYDAFSTRKTARNGHSACRQTDVDRPAPGALPSHWWRDPDFTAGSAAPVGCQLSTEQQAPPPPPPL